MREMLIDTSALIAFFINSERHHSAARRFVAQHPTTRWLILNTVFDEFVTWMRVRVSIAASIQLGHVLRVEHHYIYITDADDAATWDIFCRYDDKAWSYTDCSLLTLARRLGVNEVFAFDEHIRQMTGLGIHCVPIDPGL